jgi:hypothetical protein
MGQGVGAGSPVWCLRPRRGTDGGLNGACESAIGLQIIAAHHDVQGRLAAADRFGEV